MLAVTYLNGWEITLYFFGGTKSVTTHKGLISFAQSVAHNFSVSV